MMDANSSAAWTSACIYRYAASLHRSNIPCCVTLLKVVTITLLYRSDGLFACLCVCLADGMSDCGYVEAKSLPLPFLVCPFLGTIKLVGQTNNRWKVTRTHLCVEPASRDAIVTSPRRTDGRTRTTKNWHTQTGGQIFFINGREIRLSGTPTHAQYSSTSPYISHPGRGPSLWHPAQR